MIDPTLEPMFNELKDVDPRRAAEVAYALARLHLNVGNREKATHFGHESLRLFDQCKMETLEECGARYVTLGGIALPDLIHQEVVKNRLKELNLK